MTKKVAVINDLSGFGKCSLTAAIPVLSVLGIQCCPVATAVLTGQTGYTDYHCTDLTDMLPSYISSWTANRAEFEGIYTGFVTGPSQQKQIFKFLDAFRKENTFLLVDPVMGDDGATYSIFSDELLAGMRTLTQQASLITPNLMEACLLSGSSFEKATNYTSRHDRLQAAEEVGHRILSAAAGPQDVIITGIKYMDEELPSIYNLVVSENETYIQESFFFPKSYSGTGDLFASSMCGLKLKGYSTSQAVDITCNFLSHCIEDTIPLVIDRNDGIEFEKNLHRLLYV